MRVAADGLFPAIQGRTTFRITPTSGDYEHDRELGAIEKLRLHDPLTLRTVLRHIVTPLTGRHLRMYSGVNMSRDDGPVFFALKIGLLVAIRHVLGLRAAHIDLLRDSFRCSTSFRPSTSGRIASTTRALWAKRTELAASPERTGACGRSGSCSSRGTIATISCITCFRTSRRIT